jgi:hypothetical protein
VLRVARSVVVLRLWTAVAGAASAVAGWWLELAWLPWVLGLGAAVALWWLVSGLVGRVELGADAVRVRRLVGGVTVAADQVIGFTVRTTPFGRHVRMDRYVKGTVRLPAPDEPWPVRGTEFDAQVDRIAEWAKASPRNAPAMSSDGRRRPWLYPVLVAAVLLAGSVPDRPWGWVSTGDIGALPNLCQAVNEAAADVLGADVEPVVTDVGPGEQDCGWGDGSWSLVLTARLHLRSGLHSGSSVAAVAFTRDVDLVAEPKAGRTVSLPGFADLGDAAAATVGDSGALGVVRQANVVMAVVLLTSDPDDSGTLDDTDHDNLLKLGRAAVAAVEAA